MTLPEQESKNLFDEHPEFLDEISFNKRDQAAISFMGGFVPMDAMSSQLIAGAIALIMSIIEWITLPIEMIIRKDFGIRYISMIQFSASVFIIGLYTFVASLMTYQFSSFYRYFLWAAGAMFLYHYATIRYRIFVNGEMWHTLSRGVSRFSILQELDQHFPAFPSALIFNDSFIYRWIEPAVVWIVGYFISIVDPGFSYLLQIMAIALLVKENRIYQQSMNDIWDLYDAQIESQHKQNAVLGKINVKESQGFNTVQIPAKVREHFSVTSTVTNAEVTNSIPALSKANNDIEDTVSVIMNRS